ncbi:MAG: outer membrane beta-barrel protein [Flavobacteriaceae bacterium]|nr:outer membrane beta-barrel protein [Flavobacteriaceae bacterium]MDG2276064.1 outer membrane beta-barrel protein [Flavobacteriaceae bacterium]|tara:strand:- start:653 stop:1183 length:531 start_codon:yes stop_codon:yes gene_type:complete
MKKLLLFTALISFCFTVNAQESKFGITAGYQSSSFEISGDGVDISTDASGYFLGFFAQFSVSESLSIQPELQYSSVSDDGESIGDIIIPVMLKFHLSDKFNFMAGPQFDYITEDDTEGVKEFGMGLGLGLGYDISDNISLGARYSFGFDRLDDEGEDVGDASFKINIFQIGLNYSF